MLAGTRKLQFVSFVAGVALVGIAWLAVAVRHPCNESEASHREHPCDYLSLLSLEPYTSSMQRRVALRQLMATPGDWTAQASLIIASPDHAIALQHVGGSLVSGDIMLGMVADVMTVCGNAPDHRLLLAATYRLEDARRGEYHWEDRKLLSITRLQGSSDELRSIAREILTRALGVDYGYDAEAWRAELEQR